MVEIEGLLEEVSADPPCGPDLEYDPEFLELEQLSRGKPEQQYGETVIAAEEPNWTDVARRARDLLGRSKDLRVATLLCRALVRTEQFAGLQPGIDLIHQLLERYWDAVHPKLDAEDGDPTMRLNAMAALADPDGLLRDVRAAALVRTRSAQLLVREIEVARGTLPARGGETALSDSHIDGVIGAAAAEGALAADSVASAMQSVKTLSSALNERVGSDRAPDLKPVLATLRVLDEVLKRALPETTAGAADAEGTGGAEGVAAAGRMNVAAGQIGSRQDALLVVDKIIDYFERHEPSNPAPLLLKRAKRLMTMNFVDIIRDLVPDGMDRIETIAGITHQEE